MSEKDEQIALVDFDPEKNQVWNCGFTTVLNSATDAG